MLSYTTYILKVQVCYITYLLCHEHIIQSSLENIKYGVHSSY